MAPLELNQICNLVVHLYMRLCMYVPFCMIFMLKSFMKLVMDFIGLYISQYAYLSHSLP
jgi:hypothetical protein